MRKADVYKGMETINLPLVLVTRVTRYISGTDKIR